jgi:alpha-galactosidase
MAIEGGPDGLLWRGIRLSELVALVDGQPTPGRGLAAALEIEEQGDALRLTLRVSRDEGAPPPQSLGIRFGRVEGARSYLRNGYQSWDGSFFVPPGTTATGDEPRGKSPQVGHAMTALLPADGDGALLLGFTRHDRFQSRFRFGGTAEAMTIDVETLTDGVEGAEMEPILLTAGDAVEESLRAWSRQVAAESPLPPRIPERRITGWCSWYSLYAAIDEPVILEHLAAAAAFRDRHQVPLDVFQIDDGFTPEMGDWLDVKPQFPRGMKPLLADIAAQGFRPGLWIAPFMVGNRSRLFAEHPDWVVRRRDDGAPLAHMKFYGEFRWHKRSEEYYILDVTHPEAEAYIRRVFRTWRRDWGCLYFKTDFMLFGSDYGPDEAVWHRPGLSRIAIWRRMAALIREEIGEESLWLGCGCPLWASVGTVDAIRIGRDIGISWHGDHSAESLLRDQLTRNHAANILWQADPDCILLRDRFHELTDTEIRSLALFAGLSGGVLMTSDRLDALSEDRAALFAALLRERQLRCSFPTLGAAAPSPILQEAIRPDGSRLEHVFNPADAPREWQGAHLPPHSSRLSVPAPDDPLSPFARR